MLIILGIWALSSGAAFYLAEAVSRGSWRHSFGDYKGAGSPISFIAALPVIGALGVVGGAFIWWLTRDLAIDLDWPWRIANNGKLKREVSVTVGPIPLNLATQQGLAQQRALAYAQLTQYQGQTAAQQLGAFGQMAAPQNQLGQIGQFGPQNTPSSGYAGNGVSGGSSSHFASPGIQSGNRTRRDPAYPNTMGWRAWRWDETAKLLCSPQQSTPWHGAELRVEGWDETLVVRGVAGIHAEFVPEGWMALRSDYAPTPEVWLVGPSGCPFCSLPAPGGFGPGFSTSLNGVQIMSTGTDWICTGPPGYRIERDDPQRSIHGIVERFGKYVMGTEGWRAEWVVIRKLLAPTTEIGLALEAAYPDVEVIYSDRD